MSPETVIDWAHRISEWLAPFDELMAPSAWSLMLFVRLFADTLIIATLGWGLAWSLERRHLRKLSRAESDLAHITVSTTADNAASAVTGRMMIANVVMSHDLFLALRILFHRIVGGHVQPLKRLADRGRRQALLRLKEEAAAAGITRLVNLRIQTTPLSAAGSHRFEVSAYATAIIDNGRPATSDDQPSLSAGISASAGT